MNITQRDRARFDAKVQRGAGPDDCWLWTGAHNKPSKHSPNNVYGRFALGDHNRRIMLAHRVAVLMSGRAIPDGAFVLHQCDNPRCVNPSHLIIGTHADNMRDMVAKGRHTRGERVGTSRLTRADVRAIRAERARGDKLEDIARRWGVAISHVCNLAQGKSWSHLDAPRDRTGG